jgi:hypothetical protein
VALKGCLQSSDGATGRVVLDEEFCIKQRRLYVSLRLFVRLGVAHGLLRAAFFPGKSSLIPGASLP